MHYEARVFTGLLLLTQAVACTGDSEQTRAARPAREPASPSGAAPQIIDHNGATLRGEQARAEQQARDRQAGGARDSAAKAELQPLAGSGLRGAASLRERGKDVQIALAVQRATPGAGRVAVRDTGHCEAGGAPEKRAAAATVPSETGLGTLLVDEAGQGQLDVTLEQASLETEGRDSLLGKALVVYRMLPARAFADTTVEDLATHAIDGVLLMSPRTAAVYAGLVARHGLTAAVRTLPHFCLSKAIARRLQPLGPVPTRIAEAPRLEELLALIDESAAQSGG